MTDEIAYMLGIVAAGFAVNYLLRALPFILFAGRSRQLPGWVERLGNVISPVIIFALILYSYSGLAWRTPWPYLAGALTVGLQLWKRNPLVSIVAGTVLYMSLLAAGCSSVPKLETTALHPTIHYSDHGVYLGDLPVSPEEVPEILVDQEIPKDRVIHIRLDPNVRDLRGARRLMALIAKAGYQSPVLVTERHSESFVTGPKKAKQSVAPAAAAPARKIRYKHASE